MNYSSKYSTGLEYIIGNSYRALNYFSKDIDEIYTFNSAKQSIFGTPYSNPQSITSYMKPMEYEPMYSINHLFTPEFFLEPSRPKAKFIDDSETVMDIVEEVFELMMKEKIPDNITIQILAFEEFRDIHSSFGSWSNGILGFSINDKAKKIFVREMELDALLLVLGHEIGHVLTETLVNKHDEEAKAFAFSIEWARTIKTHNIGNLGSSISNELNFSPARNALHDVAFQFVRLMLNKGRKVMQLHDDLVKGYVSVFGGIYS